MTTQQNIYTNGRSYVVTIDADGEFKSCIRTGARYPVVAGSKTECAVKSAWLAVQPDSHFFRNSTLTVGSTGNDDSDADSKRLGGQW